MREIVLDTETTGLSPKDGHRVVEIGCVELVNHVTTGNTFHQYLNPERSMPEEALAIHGLSDEFLAVQPVMADKAEDFLAFIGDATLVIHNAEFDVRFLNAEFERLGHPAIPLERTVDTVRLAREKFPGAPASLDALCRRFEIDNSSRSLHGALLDAQLLAEVYLELIGGRQPDLALKAERAGQGPGRAAGERRPPRPHAASDEERALHAEFLKKIADPIWSA